MQKGDGVWAAFEIKLGREQHDLAAANLLKLADIVDDGEFRKPVSLNILTGFGLAHTRPDGINVIPLALLGA